MRNYLSIVRLIKDKKMKLLIVDEDIVYLDLIKKHLNSCCGDIITESNQLAVLFNREGIENFDLIIFDLNVKNINGTELIKKARKIKPDINVIIHAANKNQKVINKLKEIGIDNYFIKPGHSEILKYLNKFKEKQVLKR